MKRILCLVVILLCLSVVGCSVKQETNDEQVGIANPIKTYSSLNDINEATGCNIAIPSSLDIQNVAYTTISDEVAQVSFDYLEHSWTIRGSKNIDEDICGIYDDNIIFEKNQDSTYYVNNYYVDRMFFENQQYTLVLDNPLDIDETLFSETSWSIMKAIKNSCDPNKIAGEYMDKTSKRATMTIDKYEDNYEIYVSWATSANEYTEWNMVANFKDNKLNYSGENFSTHIFDNEGKETIGDGASNNIGYFELKNGNLYWLGASQETCKECVFEKVETTLK